MSLVLLVLWWSAAALVLYTYLLFPALVFLRGLLGRRPYKPGEITPRLSLIIAAHNEANTIGAKLDNILSLDYPHERLEVVVASDGSTDNTEAIVSRYARQGIKSLSLPRQGKAPALNAAVAASTGEILVFSDANSMYAPDALRALTRPFADPEVGGVAGDQRYLSGRRADLGSEGERRYWDFDRKLKQFQSRAGSAISATGAIYAIRRSLFRPVPAGVTDALGKKGVLDWLASSAKAPESSHQPAEQGFEFQPAKGRSARKDGLGSGSSWIIPALAVLALGFAWYLLSGPSTTEVAKNVPPPPKAEAPITTGALPEPRPVEFPSLASLSGVKIGDIDVGSEVTSAMNGMRDALAGIRDEGTAKAALDPLRRSVSDFEKVKGLAGQLTPEMRSTLASAIASARPAIDGLFDKALAIPGVSALIKPTIDSIRSELDTLATA